MNKFSLLLLTVTIFSHSFSEAKGREEEPERRPVQLLVCAEPIPELNSYSYLSASLYESFFHKNSVKVTENHCYRTNYLKCQGQELKGSWNIYEIGSKYFLLNNDTRMTYKVNCSGVNGYSP